LKRGRLCLKEWHLSIPESTGEFDNNSRSLKNGSESAKLHRSPTLVVNPSQSGRGKLIGGRGRGGKVERLESWGRSRLKKGIERGKGKEPSGNSVRRNIKKGFGNRPASQKRKGVDQKKRGVEKGGLISENKSKRREST